MKIWDFYLFWLLGAIAIAQTGCACTSPFQRGERLESAAESHPQPPGASSDSESE